MLMAVMAVCLGSFLLYHVWITTKGLTTNECFKWDEIKKWYKLEKQRYEKALKEGEVIETRKLAAPPTVSDGDVTCTPGQSSSGPSSDSEGAAAIDDVDAVVDPGPPPVNIYNRGFVENWREVIFPISKRKQLAAEAARLKNKSN